MADKGKRLSDSGTSKKSSDIGTSDEEGRSSRATMRKDLEMKIALLEEREQEYQRREEEFLKQLADKDITITELEKEVSTLQTRLYEYEAKQKRILKDVAEMKEGAKRMQEDVVRQSEEENKRRIKEKEEKENDILRIRSEMEQRQAQSEKFLALQMQRKIDELMATIHPPEKRMTSTPNVGTIKKVQQTPTEDEEAFSTAESDSEESTSSQNASDDISEEERRKETNRKKTKKKKGKKTESQKRKEKNQEEGKQKGKKHVSLDSLETSSESGNESSTDSGTSERAKVHRSILIREVAKIAPYDVYGSREVKDFFKEYEAYCQIQWPNNRKAWAEKLGEYLEGRILGFYKSITCAGDPKYDVVRERIIEQVDRIKTGIKYRKRNEFQNAKLERHERIDEFAHRLETLARKKFGDHKINENKQLLRKFLDCIPTELQDYINGKRKEKLRWSHRRLLWQDVLELLEDYSWERGEVEEGWYRVRHGQKEFSSFKDALMSAPPHLDPPPQFQHSQQTPPNNAPQQYRQQQQALGHQQQQQRVQTAAPKTAQNAPKSQRQQGRRRNNNQCQDCQQKNQNAGTGNSFFI